MDLRGKEQPGKHVREFLQSAHIKGLVLWSQQGQLRYRAPKGRLTDSERAKLRAWKDQIVELLESGSISLPPRAVPEEALTESRAPLSYSQLMHWGFIQRGERAVMRHIAAAIRIEGALSIEALQSAFAEVIRRHASLRTRIVLCDGVPVQELVPAPERALNVEDFSAVAEEHQDSEVERRIQDLIVEPIELSLGPLFGARLFRLSARRHVLAFAMEHLISDAFSRGILLREIFSAYTQLVNGEEIRLPDVQVQFPRFARDQRQAHDGWIYAHSEYWSERLNGFLHRQALPRTGAAGGKGWASVSFVVPRPLVDSLRQWTKLRGSTLAMAAFAAYTVLVLLWHAVDETVVLYESDGRTGPELMNTVGFVASTLYLRVRLSARDTFGDLLSRATTEYCRAYEHSDQSYFEALSPPPDFTHNTRFNWMSASSAGDDPVGAVSKHEVKCLPFAFHNPVLERFDVDLEPQMLMRETREGIVGTTEFPRKRFSSEAMERFGYDYVRILGALLDAPDKPVKSLTLK
jgi:hypothetical protein